MSNNPYANTNQPMHNYPPINYGNLKKREVKDLSKMEGSNPPLRTRWQTPIKKQDINLFYSQYKDFIDAAKNYRLRVLGYRDEVQKETPKRYLLLV